MGMYKKIHYFPLGLFFLILVTFLVTYSIAVFMQHVSPVLPYISETGDLSPESCIFTQLLNIGVIMLLICVYIRYRQVSEFTRKRPESGIPRTLNTLGAMLGVLTCLGLDIAANFQESRTGIFHLLGAAVCFISGSLYFCLQVCITSNMTPYACPEFMTYLRAILAALSLTFTVGTIYPGVMSLKYFKGSNFKKWTPEDGGWEWHMISVISEWLLALVYCTYILTFLPEFRKIRFTSPAIQLIEHLSLDSKDIDQEIRYV